MFPLTSVFACTLGDDVPYDVSVRLNLENRETVVNKMEFAQPGLYNCTSLIFFKTRHS